MKSTPYRYTKGDVQFIKDNYGKLDTAIIAQRFGVSRTALRDKANALGLKLPNGNRKANLEILLDGSLQSMYWIGFLLADGHFHKIGDRLRLDQDIGDISHLLKFREYVKGKTEPGISESQYNGKMKRSAYLTYVNKQVVKQLREQFEISNTKTYDPPSFTNYDLNESQWIALLIGFIDGDGSISRTQKVGHSPSISIKIEINSAWCGNLAHIKQIAYKKFGKIDKCRTPIVRTNTACRSLARTSISSPIVCNGLKTFIIENNLYVLSRKWSKIN